MTRSFRHTPIFPHSTSSSDKQYKRHSNRRLRHHWKQYIDCLMIPIKKFGNDWNSSKDGKSYWKYYRDEDMRK